MNYPKLSTTLVLTLIAAALIALAWAPGFWRDKDNAGWSFLRLFITLAAGAFLLFAIYSIIDLVTWRAVNRLEQYNRAQAITERVKILEAVRSMTGEQLAVVKASGVYIDWTTGSNGTMFANRIMTPTGEVPVDFFRLFMDLSGAENTVPIRSWNEGTVNYEYARTLTDWLCVMGWAQIAAGNRSARWINRAAAEQLLDRFAVE